jgi:deoxyribodipyrimidine photo-lyase
MLVHPARVRALSNAAPRTGPVVYWQSRDQRASDNWALLWAAEQARESGAPLLVVFCLSPTYPGATWRQYAFMLDGLVETEAALRDHGIPLILLIGNPSCLLPDFLAAIEAGCCVTDFDPLRVKQTWKQAVLAANPCPLFEVDTHNVVPCFVASPRREYAAATFRPKIHKQLSKFLEPFPDLPVWPTANLTCCPPVDWGAARAAIRADATGPPPPAPPPAAQKALERFVRERLPIYAARRNDPTVAATSELSPYFHYGQLAPQRAALAVLAARGQAPAGADAFLEECVVRRELADNFCHYEPAYDSFAARPTGPARPWPPMPPIPGPTSTIWWTSRPESPTARCVERGPAPARPHRRIHGYLRMFWAKKILEWSSAPEAALDTALYLNDRYALDGRDPNGVVGVLWSVGGLHDRPWANRPVYGHVRYMNERGCRRKFDVEAYIARFPEAVA